MNWDFPIAYGKVRGEWVTKAVYLNHRRLMAQKTERKLSKLRLTIAKMPDGPLVDRHSFALPYSDCQPTQKEREEGIPVCCNYEEMEVSRFNPGLWYCRSCRTNRVRYL